MENIDTHAYELYMFVQEVVFFCFVFVYRFCIFVCINDIHMLGHSTELGRHLWSAMPLDLLCMKFLISPLFFFPHACSCNSRIHLPHRAYAQGYDCDM